MKILHVTIGNSETHQGGLSQYCKELMKVEQTEGIETVLLYPETMTLSRKTKIVKHGGKYLIKNPLPVAITYGINEPGRYTKGINKKVYADFLMKIKPDCITMVLQVAFCRTENLKRKMLISRQSVEIFQIVRESSSLLQ